jgi:hypothetical protein
MTGVSFGTTMVCYCQLTHLTGFDWHLWSGIGIHV